MNTKVLNTAAIMAKYPEEKPVCINYADMRGELLALAEENLRLEKRLAAFEEGVNPDVADKFSEAADNLLVKLDAVLDDLNKQVSVAEICLFLENADYTAASNAIKRRYDI